MVALSRFDRAGAVLIKWRMRCRLHRRREVASGKRERDGELRATVDVYGVQRLRLLPAPPSQPSSGVGQLRSVYAKRYVREAAARYVLR